MDRYGNNILENLYLLPFGEAVQRTGHRLQVMQSVKFTRQRLSRNRYYATFNRNEGAKLVENFDSFCRSFQVPDQARTFIRSKLDSDGYYTWSAGFSEDRGGSNFKIYLLSLLNKPDIPIISVEWNPLIPDRFGIKKYREIAWDAPYRLRQLVCDALGAGEQRFDLDMERLSWACIHILEQMIDLIGALQITEQGSARSSIDFNLGRNDSVTLMDVLHHLETIADVFTVPEEDFLGWLGDFQSRRFNHFALGVDFSGHPFVTVYDGDGNAGPHAYARSPDMDKLRMVYF